MTQCAACGESFAAKRSDARFCSSRCRVAAHRRSAYPLQPLQPLHSVETCDARTKLRAVTHFDGDLDELHEIERRLALGQIDARDYERADAILQAHEQIVIRANQISVRLEKLLDADCGEFG